MDCGILITEKARSGLDLPSVGRHLGFESQLVECLGQMLCEGMPLRSVMDTSETDRRLQCMLWCLTASLFSPEGCGLLRASSSNLPSKQQQPWQLTPKVRKSLEPISSPVLSCCWIEVIYLTTYYVVTLVGFNLIYYHSEGPGQIDGIQKLDRNA